jgi:hypothetical protein
VVRIFLSYASDDRASAEAIAVRLELENHNVFFDRDDLGSGSGYDQKIREEVESCDLFIFVVSPESVASGRYTLTELKFARQKWRNLGDHVLPVMARTTKIDNIPAALSALDILVAEGNLPAEVVARVARIAAVREAWWRRKPWLLVAASVAAVMLAMVLAYFAYGPGPKPDGAAKVEGPGVTATPTIVADECESLSELGHCDSELARKICAGQRETSALLDSGGDPVNGDVGDIPPAVHFYGAVNSTSESDATQLRTLMSNVKNWMARERLVLVPSTSDARVFNDANVAVADEYVSSDRLLVVSSQLNPPYEEAGVMIRAGDSSVYFGATKSVSVPFTLPENRFDLPYELHRAAIAYSRAQLATGAARKLELLNDAREAINRVCREP